MKRDRLMFDLAAENPVRTDEARQFVPSWQPLALLGRIRQTPRSQNGLELVARRAIGFAQAPVRSESTSRRNVATLLAAATALLGLAVPALAFRQAIAESIGSFLGGDAPTQAKDAVAELVRGTSLPGIGKPDDVRLVLSAHGPEGDLQLYELRFSNGDVGTTVVDTTNDPPHTAASSWGPIRALAAGQTIDVRGSSVQFPGRSPVYFNGVIGPRVAQVQVQYPDGHTGSAVIGQGYVLGWIVPDTNGRYGDAQVIALDAHGAPVGRTDVCEIGRDVQFRAHSSEMPTDPTVACTLRPKPDSG